MKYTLYVSHNCGMSYVPERESEDLESFQARCKELNEQMLRWSLEDEDSNPVGVCGIHAGIMAMMTVLNERETQ